MSTKSFLEPLDGLGPDRWSLAQLEGEIKRRRFISDTGEAMSRVASMGVAVNEDGALTDSAGKPLADPVNHPPHYTAHPSGVECIDVTEHMSFNVGNAVKYLWRADHKGRQVEDLEKARWYVEREIQRLTKDADAGVGSHV